MSVMIILYIYIRVMYLPIMTISLSLFNSCYVYLSFYLSIYLSIYLFIDLSSYLFVYLPILIPIFVPTYLPVYYLYTNILLSPILIYVPHFSDTPPPPPPPHLSFPTLPLYFTLRFKSLQAWVKLDSIFAPVLVSGQHFLLNVVYTPRTTY